MAVLSTLSQETPELKRKIKLDWKKVRQEVTNGQAKRGSKREQG